MVFSLQILGVPATLSAAYGLAGLVVASAMMAGCGQKGPLFIATPPSIPAATANTANTANTVIAPAPANTAPAPAASAPR